MSIDDEFSHVEMERSHLAKENKQMHQRMRYLEADKKDIGDKYIQLNADYRALVKKYDQEVRCSLQSRALFRATNLCSESNAVQVFCS